MQIFSIVNSAIVKLAELAIRVKPKCGRCIQQVNAWLAADLYSVDLIGSMLHNLLHTVMLILMQIKGT